MSIKQSIRNCQIVGTVSEINMSVQDGETELNGKKVKCKVISKTEFKNPSMTIDVNEKPIGVDFIPIYEQTVDKNTNEVVHNKRFDSMKTILEQYVPKTTRVKFDGQIGLNEYVTDKGGNYEFKSNIQIIGFNPCTRSNVPENDFAEAEVSGIIAAKKPEVVNDNETGRMFVTFCSFDRDENVLPFEFIVDKDIADDFDSAYDIGDSCKIGVEVISRHVGRVKSNDKVAFGRRQSNIVSGYDKTEYCIFSGENVFEEENEYYIDPKSVKEAKKKRELMIEAMIQQKKEKAANKPKEKKGGLNSRKPVETNDDTNPWGDDDSDSLF